MSFGFQKFYHEGELPSIINRIVEDEYHHFLLSVVSKEFKSHDLGRATKSMLNSKDESRRIPEIKHINKPVFLKKFMDSLNIINHKNLEGIHNSHIYEVKDFLKDMDLVVGCPQRGYAPDFHAEPRFLFTQPGLRWTQIDALLDTLREDSYIDSINYELKEEIFERISSIIKGRMLEDIVLLDALKTLPKNRFDVFSFTLPRGEFDMVITDKINKTCQVFEIKYDDKKATFKLNDKEVSYQIRSLDDEDNINIITQRYGALKGKFLLYRGPSFVDDSGVIYRNIENFLENLPYYSQEEDPDTYNGTMRKHMEISKYLPSVNKEGLETKKQNIDTPNLEDEDDKSPSP